MKTLQDYRNRIDALDDQILDLLQERFEIVGKVGHYKAQNALDVVQTGRVQEVLDRVEALARARGLDPALITLMYRAMIDHAHVIEGQIRQGYSDARARG
jgi:chorismate mutase